MGFVQSCVLISFLLGLSLATPVHGSTPERVPHEVAAEPTCGQGPPGAAPLPGPTSMPDPTPCDASREESLDPVPEGTSKEIEAAVCAPGVDRACAGAAAELGAPRVGEEPSETAHVDASAGLGSPASADASVALHVSDREYGLIVEPEVNVTLDASEATHVHVWAGPSLPMRVHEPGVSTRWSTDPSDRLSPRELGASTGPAAISGAERPGSNALGAGSGPASAASQSGARPGDVRRPTDDHPQVPPNGAAPTVWTREAGGGLPVAIVSAGLVAIGSALLGLWRVGAGLFSRLRPDSLLQRLNRRRIMEELEARPWSSLHEIRRATGLSRATLRHHLRILRTHRLVQCMPSTHPARFAPARAAAFVHPVHSLLVRAVGGEPLRLNEVMRRLMASQGYTWSGAWKAIRAAEHRGLVNLESRARTIWVHRVRR